MEILLLITIVIIALAIMNFKDYLYNPHKRPRIENSTFPPDDDEFDRKYDIYATPTKEEKIRSGEYGLIVGILSKLAHVDGRVCELEFELIENTIEDIANQILMQSAMHQREEIIDILHEIFNNTYEDLEDLTCSYANFTKGQYKRRLKLVEYMLSLAYADGNLGDSEREVILDVAAFLEIDNGDFNRLYDDFANFYSNQSSSMSVSEACKILGVEIDDDIEKIKKKYKSLVRENHPDILQHKGLDSSIIETHTKKLQDINEAYELIKNHKKTEYERNGEKTS